MRTVRSRSLLGIAASVALMATMLFGAGTASAAGADTCTSPATTSVLECAQVPAQPATGVTAPGSASEVGSATEVAPAKTVVTRAPAVQEPVMAPAPEFAAPAAPYAPSDGTYTNVDGNQVERPDDNPVGATAICNDGKYSHSLNRSGTCSHNGGVRQFLTGYTATASQAASSSSNGYQFNGNYWDDGQGHHRYGWGWNSARHCYQYAAPPQVHVKVSQVGSVPTGGVDTGDGSFGP